MATSSQRWFRIAGFAVLAVFAFGGYVATVMLGAASPSYGFRALAWLVAAIVLTAAAGWNAVQLFRSRTSGAAGAHN